MLSVEEARALVTTSLTDEDLADVIAREEAWLARKIGPLDGERTETFSTPYGDEVLRLRRPAASVEVEDDAGSHDDHELHGWSDLVLLEGSRSWGREVRVAYTPSDDLEVKRALVTLVRLSVSESAYVAQSAGGYSATSSLLDQRTTRYSAWRSLLRPQEARSIRIRSSVPHEPKALGPVAVAASGS